MPGFFLKSNKTGTKRKITNKKNAAVVSLMCVCAMYQYTHCQSNRDGPLLLFLKIINDYIYKRMGHKHIKYDESA